MDKENMSQIILVFPDMSLLELQNNVVNKFFTVTAAAPLVVLSYWPPNTKELVTGISTPPVMLIHHGFVLYFYASPLEALRFRDDIVFSVQKSSSSASPFVGFSGLRSCFYWRKKGLTVVYVLPQRLQLIGIAFALRRFTPSLVVGKTVCESFGSVVAMVGSDEISLGLWVREVKCSSGGLVVVIRFVEWPCSLELVSSK
ncbi:hypothetical protein HID58_058966 [Brassica napus]|uniref:Uncharacterized protein n=1 Tax=Brassica napus TaxID=3708 RepID=A0ABQ7ZRJ9_BRANA|nr:hypothetical protein HID58_058966 [Brassica napus]